MIAPTRQVGTINGFGHRHSRLHTGIRVKHRMRQQHGQKMEHPLSNSVGAWKTWLPFVVAAIFVRLLLTALPAYAIDMNGYVGWSRFLADSGPSRFYGTFHVVYAPLFHYFLWFTGEVAKVFHFSAETHAYAIKLWSVLADAAGAGLLLWLARDLKLARSGWPFALMYFMNPAVLFNTSVWGQFDGIPGTLLFAVLLLFRKDRPIPAALLFVAAVLVKPQSGLLAPLVLLLFLRAVAARPWRRALLCTGLTLVGGIGLYLAVVLPFYTPTSQSGTLPGWLDPFWWLFDLYLRSMQDYPYGTANAWNLWYLLGGQIRPDSTLLRGLPHAVWGLLLLLPFVVWALWLGTRRNGQVAIRTTQFASDPLLMPTLPAAWLLLFSAYLLMTKMHERYLVPALLIGTAAALVHRQLLPSVMVASLVSFLNQLVLYQMSFSGAYWLSASHMASFVGSSAMTLAFLWTGLCLPPTELPWNRTTRGQKLPHARTNVDASASNS